MFGLTPIVLLSRLGYALLWSVLCFASGYLYKGHRDSLAEAALAATQSTAQITSDAAGKASDTVQLNTLKSQLAASTSTAASLQRTIAELYRANPPTSVCAIPDGLRASINANLAAR